MRYDNLQCFRAVAAAAVVLMHAPHYATDRLGTPPALTDPRAQMFTGGLAVVVFYALSGFVLTHALRTGPLRAFVALRLLRLYPAFWAASALALAVHLSLGTLLPFGWSAAGYLPRMPGFWQAVLLAPAAPGAVFVLGVEWTLVYEVRLSLALAVLVAVAGRGRGLGVAVAAWLGLCLLKQVIHPVGYNVPGGPSPAAWPLAVPNVPFLLGVLAYLTRDRWAGSRWALVAATAALIGAAVVPLPVSGWTTVLQGTAAALVIGSVATARQVRPDHPLVALGDWSYGVYLLHRPVLVVFFTLTARHGWFPPAHLTVVLGGVLALAVGAAFGAAESAAYQRVRAALRRRERRAAGLTPAVLRRAA